MSNNTNVDDPSDYEFNTDDDKDPNYLEIIDSKPEIEDFAPVLWGRLWSAEGDTSVAFYIVADPRASKEENEDVDPLLTLRLAVFGEYTNLDEFDPKVDSDEFERRLLNYNLADVPVPQVLVDETESSIQSYFNASRVNWLIQFIENNNSSQLESFLERLFEDIVEHDRFVYQVRCGFQELELRGEEQSKDTSEPSADADENTEQTDTDDAEISVKILTSPSEGVPPSELNEGMEIMVRITGRGTKFLPDELIDESVSDRCSVPMQAEILAIEEDSDISEHEDADPEDYIGIRVRIQPGVKGYGNVFREDPVKLAGQKETDDDDEIARDFLILGVLLGIILLIILILNL